MSKPVVEKSAAVKLEDFGLPADFDIDKEMAMIRAGMAKSEAYSEPAMFDEATRKGFTVYSAPI